MARPGGYAIREFYNAGNTFAFGLSKQIYEVVDVRERGMVEEYRYYLGTDFEASKQTKSDLITSNESHLTPREKKHAYVEARIYEISDDVDLSDDEAVTDAICECGGYDTF